MESNNKAILKTVDRLIENWNIKAVIFDLDGTLIDNNAFHLETWKRYLEKEKINIADTEFRQHINGRTNKDAIEYIYGRKITAAEAMVYAEEKEALYRELYQNKIKPVTGLLDLLEGFHLRNIPMAIATSGIPVNIAYMFEHIPIQHYFKKVVDSTQIKSGKPNPEIYLKTSELLNIAPANCLVFEDAVVGVHAGKSAGMKVIAITTTQLPIELKDADMLIENFNADSFFK